MPTLTKSANTNCDSPNSYSASQSHFKITEISYSAPPLGYFGITNLLKKIDVKLDELLQYEKDWDGEDALPLSRHVANQVKQLLNKASNKIIGRGRASEWSNPRVALLPNGGLDLEWEVNNRRLIFFMYPSNKVEYLRKIKRAKIDDGLVENFDEAVGLILWVHSV